MQPGKPASRDCQKCFRQISVSFESAAFQFVVAQERAQKAGQAAQEERSGMSSAQRRNAKRDALAAALEKLQVGQPLPNVGTCKHYRHSHRSVCQLRTERLHQICIRSGTAVCTQFSPYRKAQPCESLEHVQRLRCRTARSDCVW